MKLMKSIRMDDLLATGEDLSKLVVTIDELPEASEEYENKYRFLKNQQIIDGVVYRSGHIYQCVHYYETDAQSGIPIKKYRWELATFTETGKLAKCTNFLQQEVISEPAYSENTMMLTWDDPDDYIDKNDPANNAVWQTTLIIRKLGSTRPTSIYDGEVVGWSSRRNQYTKSNDSKPFTDHVEKNIAYSYNLFAITRCGVATGLDDSDSSELTWKIIQKLVKQNLGGTIFTVGDCVTVKHNVFGELDLQVAYIGHVNELGTEEENGIIFVSRDVLIRCSYDAKEHEEMNGEKNPACSEQIRQDLRADKRGYNHWLFSNLRRWLNAEYGYKKTNDPVYQISKCYFEKKGDEYELVPIPVYPEKTNPTELGYYEADWELTPCTTETMDTAGTHPQDKIPGDDEVGFVYGSRNIPGFLQGLEADFREVLAQYLSDTTATAYSYATWENGDRYPTYWAYDYIFIPSYADIVGEYAPGFENQYDGVFREEKTEIPLPLFNKNIHLPALGDSRSLLKYDLDGQISGYYLRTPETVQAAGSSTWYVPAASGVWAVKSEGFTEKPPLDTKVSSLLTTVGVSLSKKAYETRDKNNNRTAPGVVWCCVVG